MGLLTEISLGTAVLVIFAICFGFLLLRGMVKLLFAALLLGVSCGVAFKVWQNAPQFFLHFTDDPPEFLVSWLPLIAGVFTYFMLRKVLKLLKRPIAEEEDDRPRSMLLKLTTAVVAAAVFILIGATVVRYFTSVEEIEAVATERQPAEKSWASSLTGALDWMIPESVSEMIDPMTSEARMQLATRIASHSIQEGEESNSSTDASLVMTKKSLLKLLDEGRYSTFLRHPALDRALKDKGVYRFFSGQTPGNGL